MKVQTIAKHPIIAARELLERHGYVIEECVASRNAWQRRVADIFMSSIRCSAWRENR